MDAADVDVRYSPDHLWLREDGRGVTIGVTEQISRVLTWVNDVALPVPGARFEAGEQLAQIDSQKADIAITAPAALEVVAVNDALRADPMLVRMDPRGRGWLVVAELVDGGWDRLLEPAAYDALLREQS
jgi:glycine cleavage system H protein